MTTRRGRRQSCGRAEAQSRLQDARAHLELSSLADSSSSAADRRAACSAAVLAGIAASDVACCAALGERSRSADHRDAVTLLRLVTPGGADAAKQLSRLLSTKDASQYGLREVGGPALLAARRQAVALVAFAEAVVLG